MTKYNKNKLKRFSWVLLDQMLSPVLRKTLLLAILLLSACHSDNSQASDTVQKSEPNASDSGQSISEPESPDVPVDFQATPEHPQRSIKAGVYISPPFVESDGSGYTGMAIDLWEKITTQHGLKTQYQAYPTLRSLINAVDSGEADVAVTNLTITQDRAATLSFTQPWYDAGLRIMVSNRKSHGFKAVVEGLKRRGYLASYGWLLAVILVATLLSTLFDRKFDDSYPRRWRDGIAEGFYSVMSVAVSGKSGRKNLFGWVGRIWAGIWLACGVAVFAYITSSVTSVMTTLSLLDNRVNSVIDLPGNTVGVFSGSVAEEVMLSLGVKTVAYDGLTDAVSALKASNIDAIVGDAPVLEYYVHIHPKEPVKVVGMIFHPDKYGFALHKDSNLTRPVTVTLLGLQEAGLVKELKGKYFGVRH